MLPAAEHLTGDAHNAQDLLQNALAKVYVSWGAARRADSYLYVRRVLINCHIDSWRRRRWREHTVADPSEVSAALFLEDSSQWVANRDALARALAKLTPRERTIVVLRYLKDMPERDVAELVGVSAGTVKSTASRALQKWRTHPLPHLEEERTVMHDVEDNLRRALRAHGPTGQVPIRAALVAGRRTRLVRRAVIPAAALVVAAERPSPRRASAIPIAHTPSSIRRA